MKIYYSIKQCLGTTDKTLITQTLSDRQCQLSNVGFRDARASDTDCKIEFDFHG